MASPRDNLGRFVKGTHWRPHAPFRNRDFLLSEYETKGRSASEIAASYGITESVSEARTLKHWGVSGSANPMFGRFGALNPRYIDGSSPERQSAYARVSWKEVKKTAIARDGYRYRRCHAKDGRMVVHHLRPWAGNPDVRLSLDNIVSLCEPCHRWVHSHKNENREWLA